MKTGFFHASLYFAFHFNVSVTAGCYSSLYNNYMCGEFKVPCTGVVVFPCEKQLILGTFHPLLSENLL